MNDWQDDLAEVKSFITHHRIITYGMLVVLAILTYGFVTLVHRQNSTAVPVLNLPQKTAPQTSKIVPQTDYANPFDKNTQYTNPFDKYKNPFDSLK